MSTEYNPPTSEVIRSRQNEPDALRLLIVQRRLYRDAKRWLGLRWFGMAVIGTGAPVVSVLSPQLAVVAGAVAGAWIFTGRTALVTLQSRASVQAAAVREWFDCYIYGMPDTNIRSVLPLRERIAKLAGPDDRLRQVAEGEDVVDWYPINVQDDGVMTVAISQRANAAYTDGLLRTTAIVWSVAITAWCLALLVVSLLMHVTLEAFLFGMLLPLLPAFLDVIQYVFGVWRSAGDRTDLARTIEERLGEDRIPDPQELLVWQERLYSLRKEAPVVPDLLYKIKRKKYEAAMHSAASQLSYGARNDG
ncbi:S-4TM family putative pore-forming effector [Corynebacterium sp. P7003]|uniref:S-4TM family putative pore-forming effector n=1 Tax=Corynebacterium pygosceleis TaxID=2800406 RepID=A0ABT3WSU8_9CORY|nr:S-4TM family putative pore-forming effector [Corynebacterium pygosceleis]MCX7444399.1 S-4TM family putative pore-forming effector [Corynebacterium pygosceleis]